MKQQEKQYADDDGRVVCNMDVSGMPWHEKRIKRLPFEKRQTAHSTTRGDAMTDSEARRYTWYAVLAGLLIVAIFSAVWVLFVLFCTEIWFA